MRSTARTKLTFADANKYNRLNKEMERVVGISQGFQNHSDYC